MSTQITNDGAFSFYFVLTITKFGEEHFFKECIRHY